MDGGVGHSWIEAYLTGAAQVVLSLGVWVALGWLAWRAKRRWWDPAAANAARIRAEALAYPAGPEGLEPLGELLDRHLALGQPVVAVFSVTATRQWLSGRYLGWFVVACFFPPTLMIILAAVFVLFVTIPLWLGGLLIYLARETALAPAGGLGDLLVVQPGRVTLLQGVRADPLRGTYEVRTVAALPRVTTSGADLALLHALEEPLEAPHVHLKADGRTWHLRAFPGPLPLDRLPPRYRDRLRPFAALPAQLAGGEA